MIIPTLFPTLFPLACPFAALNFGRHWIFLHSRKICLVTLLSILFSTPAYSANLQDTEMPLTLDTAQRRAIARSRQLPAQDYSAAASREMALAAGQLPDPVLKFGVDNLPVSGADRFSLTKDFMTMRRIGVMQEITRSDKRQLRAQRYERLAEKSLAEKNVTAAAIERDTALAWFDLYYAQAMGALIAEQGEQARLEIQAAEAEYRAGRASQADILAARIAWAGFAERASEVQRRILNAKTMLARWVGNITGITLASKPDMDAIRLDLATLDTQLAHHPQVAVLGKQEEIATAEARLAQANKNPDWTVEVAFQQRSPAYSNMISAGVSIPLQWDQKKRQDRELSSKMAMIEQAQAERDEVLREHVALTRMQINEWQNNRERQGRYQRELIPLANDRTLAVLTAYRGGKSGLADVLAARRNQIEVRLQALQLEADTARLWAQLNFLFPSHALATHVGQPIDSDPK